MNSPYDFSFFHHLSLGNESFSLEEKFREVSGTGREEGEGCLRSMGMFDEFFRESLLRGGFVCKKILDLKRKGSVGKLFFHACVALTKREWKFINM